MSHSAAAKTMPQAEITVGHQNGIPTVEVEVPRGTKLAQAVSLHDLISRELISKISPRGCQQCISGANINIREKFQEVISVELPVGLEK